MLHHYINVNERRTIGHENTYHLQVATNIMLSLFIVSVIASEASENFCKNYQKHKDVSTTFELVGDASPTPPWIRPWVSAPYANVYELGLEANF